MAQNGSLKSKAKLPKNIKKNSIHRGVSGKLSGVKKGLFVSSIS